YDGARVNEVQSALAREGYYDGPIDGRLNSATRKALRKYQRDHGLDATGNIDRAVIEALRLR
ncbi:MAG TPA: peptidoglycan-binding protein, partial [Chthoniobacterales bacterium]